ncbi:MAG: ATP-binding protein [Bacteroidota bacterium]|nr:ATP-binding protein [Bacteroidota bacterium]
MINRGIENRLLKLANSFKAVVLTGPRQSGKTTIVKALFPDKDYISLENPQSRFFALEDPQGFLANLPNGAILDEVQRVPELFSYLQEILDNSTAKGQFILTGSNNLLLQQNISQTLAGRVAHINLLPFTYSELSKYKHKQSDDELILSGFYPPVFDQKLEPAEWYPSYIRTYIERDVRQIKNITDLIQFERFMRILAGRTAQELNLTAISNVCGVDVKTVQSWISVLEASYIIFLLKPHHKNFNKTIVKRPKLYFFDPGIVSSLLGIKDINQLKYHPLKGSIFETMVVSEEMKKLSFSTYSGSLFYWRDKTGHEVDLILEKADSLFPIEIKSSQTINSDYFKNLIYWLRLAKINKGTVLYAGDETQNRSNGIQVVNWRIFNSPIY